MADPSKSQKTNIVPGQKLRDQMAQHAARQAKSPVAAGASPAAQAVPAVSLGASASATPTKTQGGSRGSTPSKELDKPKDVVKSPALAPITSTGIATAEGLDSPDVKERTEAAKKMWQDKDKQASSSGGGKQGKKDSKAEQKKGGKDAAPALDPAIAALVATDPAVIAAKAKVDAQGTVVRDLKSQKADKATIDANVQTLLALKADLSAAEQSSASRLSAAGSASPVSPAPAPAAAAPAAAGGGGGGGGGGGADASEIQTLRDRVAAQGNLVRELKGKKADKAQIDAEVKTLLALKDQLGAAEAKLKAGVGGGAAAAPAAAAAAPAAQPPRGGSKSHEVVSHNPAVLRNGVLFSAGGVGGSPSALSSSASASASSSSSSSLSTPQRPATAAAAAAPEAEAGGAAGVGGPPAGGAPKVGFVDLPVRIPRVGLSFLQTERGLLVDGLVGSAPADRAGLRKQDMLLRVNKEPVKNPDDYFRALSSINPPADVEFEVRRGAGTKTLVMKVTELVVVRRETRLQAPGKKGGQGPAEAAGGAADGKDTQPTQQQQQPTKGGKQQKQQQHQQ